MPACRSVGESAVWHPLLPRALNSSCLPSPHMGAHSSRRSLDGACCRHQAWGVQEEVRT